jgi:hypothetical protein
VVFRVGTKGSVTNVVNEYKSLRQNKASGTLLVAPEHAGGRLLIHRQASGEDQPPTDGFYHAILALEVWH